MLLQIAWRNIWRNITRSFVVICSIIIGLWAGVFILAFAWGMYQSNIDDSVYKQLSHIQIHHPSFRQENDVQFSIANADVILDEFQKNPKVLCASARVITTGMISSTTTASGVKLYGIQPEAEEKQIGLKEMVTSGNYFESGKKNEILLGEKLAKKLKVKLKSKVVLTFTDLNSNIISAAFRVEGIYRSKNISLDEVNVYVRQDHLRELIGLKTSETNEIAILLKNENEVDAFKNYSTLLLPEAKVENWKELSPELGLVIESFNMYTYIIIGIILLALTFGIINTMLMSVLERIRELGMLMAIGLNKYKIFIMIMLETIYLTLIGCPFGLLLGWLSNTFFGNYGINIAMFSEGLASYGFSSVIYPSLESQKYLLVAVMCILTAILSAIYPALKALQLNPAEAIRKI